MQLPTIGIVENYFGAHSVGLGLYYGLQTVFFEVGLAFLFAWYGVKHGHLGRKDAEGYGSGLAFWENAALLGLLPLINLVTYYGILSTNAPVATTLYNQLQTSAPGLFAPASQALGTVAVGIWERISSIMIHFAWGYLCIMAAVYNKKRLFLIALPMGLVDFLVPFATAGNLILFEGVSVCVGCSFGSGGLFCNAAGTKKRGKAAANRGASNLRFSLFRVCEKLIP